MKFLPRLMLLLMSTPWLVGCQNSDRSSARDSIDTTLPYLSARELHDRLAKQDGPVLVEFCVPSGCARCETMRSQVNELAQGKAKEVAVLRVDFTLDRALANQLGVTVCPSYLAFDGGQELFRISYPTSGDLLASALDRLRTDETPVDELN